MAAQPIVYIEFPASDPKAAGAFYGDVFGWQIETPSGFDDYPQFRAEGGPSGAFTRIGGGLDGVRYAAGEPLIYVASQDIDADLQRVEAQGGQTVLPKTEIPHVGWWAVFRDPSGNKVGLFHRTGRIAPRSDPPAATEATA